MRAQFNKASCFNMQVWTFQLLFLLLISCHYAIGMYTFTNQSDHALVPQYSDPPNRPSALSLGGKIQQHWHCPQRSLTICDPSNISLSVGGPCYSR